MVIEDQEEAQEKPQLESFKAEVLAATNERMAKDGDEDHRYNGGATHDRNSIGILSGGYFSCKT